MAWLTVPNIFPEYDDLANEDKYNLFEGYGVSEYETKSSGKYYVKIRVHKDENPHNLLMYLGYSDWHKKWKIRRNPIKRFFLGAWERKEIRS